jgi:probable HAF family extracellular repeat protein
MKPMKILLHALALTLALAGCSSATESADRDGDGIPNEQDAFADDPARFSRYATVLLDRLTGGLFSAAVGINGRNEVVGVSDDGQGTMKAVRWSVSGTAAGAPAQLAPIAGNGYSAAYAIGDDGVAVGESAKGSGFVAVAWPAGASSPTELSLAGFGAPAAAYGISGSRIVGEAVDAGNTVAILWAAIGANPVSLGTLGGATSSAYAIASAGFVVGESVDGSGARRGALWKVTAAGAPAAPVALAPLAGHVASVGLGVNAAGEIVGESESASGETHGVLWKLDAAGAPGAPVDLGIASASAVNASDRIVGCRSTPGHASAWDTRNTSLADAILTGTFTVSQAYGVNDLNSVVGMADNQGFVAVPQ